MSSSPRPSSRLCCRRLSRARRSHSVSAPRMKGAEGETLVTPFDFSVIEAKLHRQEAESEGALAPEEKSCAVSLHQLESQSHLSCSLSCPSSHRRSHRRRARGGPGLYHSPALPHTGITAPLSHQQQPATASRLPVLQATLLITSSLSAAAHLCL